VAVNITKQRAGVAAALLEATVTYLNDPAPPDADGNGVEDSRDPYPYTRGDLDLDAPMFVNPAEVG
jgi:hypothetical protein